MINDGPIHLGNDQKEVKITLFQHNLDGMCVLIHYCEGLEKSGNGDVPGLFDLIMHYREIRSALQKNLIAV